MQSVWMWGSHLLESIGSCSHRADGAVCRLELFQKPNHWVLCWMSWQGVTLLSCVFQMQSSLMEAFNTQAKPTIKTNYFLPSNRTFYPQNRLFTFKTDSLPSKRTALYLRKQRLFTFKLDITNIDHQNLEFIIETFTIKTKSNHKWCLTFLYRILPWKTFF